LRTVCEGDVEMIDADGCIKSHVRVLTTVRRWKLLLMATTAATEDRERML
jgi:hypothetical protein